MQSIVTSNTGKTVGRALLAGALMFALAIIFIELTRHTGRIASVWLANGAVLAVMLRARVREWPWILTAAFTANLAANFVSRDGIGQALALSSCNLIEMGIVALAMRKIVPVEDLCAHRPFFTFTAASLVAPLVSGAIASTYLAGGFNGASYLIFRTWYFSDALGLMMVTPLAFVLTGRWSPPRDVRSLVEPVAFIMTAALATFLAFSTPLPHMFLPLPVLLLAGLRLQVVPAALVAATSAIIAIAMTIAGKGPVAGAPVSAEASIFLIQAYVATAVFLTMPVSAVTRQRNELGVALRRRERQFRLLAEASPAAILHCDAYGRATYINPRWAELTGNSLDDVRQFGWDNVIDEEERGRARVIWDRVRETGGEAKICLPCRFVDREQGWADVYITPESNDEHEVAGWVVRLLDASERIRWSIAVEQSEAHYRLLADNAHDIIMRLAADGTQTFVSAASKRLLGRHPDAMAGRPARDFIHGDDWPRVELALARAVSGGEQVVAYRMLRETGLPHWVEAAFNVVEGGEDSQLEIVASIRDIDRRHQAEQAAAIAATKLGERNRLLTMAEEMAGVGHWHFELESGLLSLSSSAAQIAGLGHPATIAPGLALSMVSTRDRGTVLRMIASAMHASRGLERQVTITRASDDEERIVRMAVDCERDEAGKAIGLIAMIHDITDKVADEQKLIAALDEAKLAAEAKSAFLATMSHEIRTPLTGVLGMIELLDGDVPEKERRAYLATLKQSAGLLMAVLNDILDFSKMEHGSLELTDNAFDLAGLVQSTVDLFGNAASQKNLLLTASIDPAVGWASGDPVRLQQVVSNLVNNGIKFTNEGSVEVSVAPVGASVEDAQRWRFEVKDSGIGIASTQLAGLFDPFAQADISNQRRFGGTGLGLAISRRLVEAMGGVIGVESEPGKGSTFWFEVNLAPAEARPAISPPPKLARANHGDPLNVLVAEDNPVNQLLVTTLLKRLGHEVTCVNNGLEAVDAASNRLFDCILMDMQMPEMDGIGATRAIRTGGGPCAEIPIIALTADAAPERRRFYDNAGLTDFMTKPVDCDLLGQKLAQIGAGRRGDETTDIKEDPTAAAFDGEHMDDIRDALGDERFRGLLALFAKETARRPAQIRAHLEEERWDELAAEAHSLKGAALSIGASELAAAAEKIEGIDAESSKAERLAACALLEQAAATAAQSLGPYLAREEKLRRVQA